MKFVSGLLGLLVVLAVGCGTERKKHESAEAPAGAVQQGDTTQGDDKAPAPGDIDQGDIVDQGDAVPVDQGDAAPKDDTPADDKEVPVDQAKDQGDVDQGDVDQGDVDQGDKVVDQGDVGQGDVGQGDKDVDQGDKGKDVGLTADEERVQALISELGRDGFVAQLNERLAALETSLADFTGDNAQELKDKVQAKRTEVEALQDLAEDMLIEQGAVVLVGIEQLEAAVTATRG